MCNRVPESIISVKDFGIRLLPLAVLRNGIPLRIGNPHYDESMVFDKRLRDGVRDGDITLSIRIWKNPRVKVGSRYPMETGQIEIDSIDLIDLDDITPELARRSGFPTIEDLLKVARHGKGQNVYFVRFHYLPPRISRGRTKSRA